MPQFQLSTENRVGQKLFSEQNIFTQAYIEAMFWADIEDREEYSEGVGYLDLSSATLQRIEEDCRLFWERNKDLEDLLIDRESDAGHDFWLTRQGHGAGFWDGDWPEPDATILTDAAHAFGEFYLEMGDDGLIHHMG